MKNLFICLLCLLIIVPSIASCTSQPTSQKALLPDIQSSHHQRVNNPILNRIEDILNYVKSRNQPNMDIVSCEQNEFSFTPEPITLPDDAFHGASGMHFTEWWYFDATLNDGYSIQMIYHVYSMFKQYVFVTKLNLYQDGNHLIKKEAIFLPNQIEASTAQPFIVLDGKQVLQASIKDGNLIYNLHMEFDSLQADFQFTGTTPGWKGEIPFGEWIVPLPKADVQGVILVDDTPLEFTGVGYHDHNAGITVDMGTYFGWYWGKIHLDDMSITWSDLMPTWFEHQPLLVINIDDDTFINIESDDIEVKADEFFFEDGCLIPHAFIVSAHTEEITLHITMDVEQTHHIKVGPVKYWRYHVDIDGSLVIHGEKQHFHQQEITEFMRFR